MKAAIYLATGFEEIEAVNIMDVLRRGRVDLEVVSVTGDLLVEGGHGIPLQCDRLFEEKKEEACDLLILPGGMPGTLNLGEHQGLGDTLKEAHRQGKRLAAICAAPSVLGGLGILQGKKATCYPGYEGKMEGAKATGLAYTKDGNIFTAKGAGVAMDFGFELLTESLPVKDVEKLAKAMQSGWTFSLHKGGRN
ncbi:DJ-1 family glyoxalase III [Anaerotalea alkaliphila]|uniref:DJ-1/PfpI family protein n=1 Tax=Anaerotalea alkaliphila TaxID=2662126 RepID=A0A7X5HTQ7_9FIRM|nr:DJ-1 family glyoxalase III [Anaerotalea alkaliphila]NDL66486.1 DJ-1/PfpI family protein [Anaerotalea alkaliphila]